MEQITLTAIQTLGIMPSMKGEIASFKEKILNEIDDGNIDALKIHIQLKALESLIKGIVDTPRYKVYLRDEAEKNGKSFEKYGAKIECVEVGTKYNFSQCGHLEYNDLCEKIKELNTKKEEFETLLKAIKTVTPFIVYGEAVELYPPTKTSISSVKVTF